MYMYMYVYMLGLGDNKNYVSQLLPKGDMGLLQYCNYSLILSMITKIGSFLKDDTSDPCFESIWLNIKCMYQNVSDVNDLHTQHMYMYLYTYYKYKYKYMYEYIAHVHVLVDILQVQHTCTST